MASDFDDKCIERDTGLVDAFRLRGKDQYNDFNEWVTEELKALIYESQLLEQLQKIPATMAGLEQEIRGIQNLSVDASNRTLDRIASVKNGTFDYSNVLEVHRHLGEALDRYEHIIHELLKYRDMIVNLRM